MLAVTQFLAFGDSMTAGEVVSEGYGPPGCFGAVSTATPTVLRPLKIDLTVAYPTDLQSSLRRRYTTQSATVQNVGCQGETTAEGLVRLSTVLASASQAQALLLLEGVNDISGGSPFITAAVRNVDAMIRLALSRKLRVIVGTLPPQNAIAPTGSGESCVSRNSGADFVTPFNSALKLMVASEGVPVADIYEAFNGNVSMLIDCDGLHPTAAGYQTISDTFFNTIAKNFETSPTTTATPTFAPRVDRTRRR